MSNRLPTRLQVSDGEVRALPSSGGLASALAGFRSGENFAWVGWPGCVIPEDLQPQAEEILAHDRLVPVHMGEREESHYYQGICNEVLWPLCHYFTSLVRFRPEAWADYVAVNRLFADKVLEQCEDDTRVWVHDFHLMLVPSMLREARPDLEIGFFLHIPFPSTEIWRVLPTREELLLGMLGADYIGFHTHDYARHFRSACLRVLGLESEPRSIAHEGRRVGIGANPIGIDVAHFEEALDDPETARLREELQRRYAGRKLVLGVERLDYSKGIPLKLEAFERFLERDPSRASEVTLLQVLVPSRLDQQEYKELKSDIEEEVGRINGVYGGPGVTPVEYMHRSISPQQLAALYRHADVGLVTPVRDGMNLVAQEYVLCQKECALPEPHKGILVLSEFAGAAHYLGRSILVNPWNIEQTADGLETALAMGDADRGKRMSRMAKVVESMDCRNWAKAYLDDLGRVAKQRRATAPQTALDEVDVLDLSERFARAPHRVIALDYDGTLREITRRPHEAAPTGEIKDLLRTLADLPDTDVHIVSGRKYKTMQEWFGDLPVHLCAEHGFQFREPDGEWVVLHDVDLSWMADVKETLDRVSSEVPGTLVERKSCALAWHYRMADLDYGAWRARELLDTLEASLARLPVEIIAGNRVVEVRAVGVNKGSYVARVLRGAPAGAMVLCAGDDRTDLDMYRALPSGAVTIHVGSTRGETTYSLDSPARLRAVLRSLVERSGAPVAPAGV